uniref:Uncharacterized protein n=1 Tax=viral metagenome TaxID=1070528 RepID=A0A6M3KKT1_9ZZZZ
MPNGFEFLTDLDVDKLIKEKKDRELLEFVARQAFDTKKEMTYLNKTVSANTKRSITNRWTLITLIILLIALGVIDSNVIHLLGI